MKIWLATLMLCCVSPAAMSAVTSSDAWARATPPGSTVGVVYAQLHSTLADELVAITTDVAERVEIHTSSTEGGTMKMRAVTSVPLPANKAVVFRSGDLHVMLIGLRKPLLAGSTIALEFKFRSAPALSVTAKVVAPSEAGPSSAHEHPTHGK